MVDKLILTPLKKAVYPLKEAIKRPKDENEDTAEETYLTAIDFAYDAEKLISKLEELNGR